MNKKIQKFKLNKNFQSFFGETKSNYYPYLSTGLIIDYEHMFTQSKDLPFKSILQPDALIGTEMTIYSADPTTNILYIFSHFDYTEYLDTFAPTPSDKEEPDAFELARDNLIKSDSLKVENFIKLTQNWHQLNLQKVPFALLYQDEQDWIACKGFETQEAMEAFIKQHSDEQL